VSFYEKHILPRLLDLSMRHRALTPYRRRTIAAASGAVLEIGVGSGLNLPLYEIDVDRVYGIDPSGGDAGHPRDPRLVRFVRNMLNDLAKR